MKDTELMTFEDIQDASEMTLIVKTCVQSCYHNAADNVTI